MLPYATGCALIVLLFLGGCAAFTLTEAECLSTNWYERAKEHGFGGHPTQMTDL